MAQVMTRYKVFVYGTLKSTEPNHSILWNFKDGVPVYIGNGLTIQRFPLVIASKYNIPFLLNCQGKGHNVFGEIYEVNGPLLAELDKLEDHPKLYERQIVDVSLMEDATGKKYQHGNRLEECWVYILKMYKPYMMSLPFLQNYTSQGSHGLEYVARYKRYSKDYDFKDDVKMPLHTQCRR